MFLECEDTSQFLFSDEPPRIKDNNKMPKTFLDSNLYYPDAFDTNPFEELTLTNNKNRKYLDMMNGFNLSNINNDNFANEVINLQYDKMNKNPNDDDNIFNLLSNNSESLNFT